MLSSGQKVNDFVAMVTKYRFPIYLTTGRYRIDAKSLIGIFSLNLSKPVTVEVNQEGEEVEQLFEELRACLNMKTSNSWQWIIPSSRVRQCTLLLFYFASMDAACFRERLPIFHAIIQLLALYILGNFHGGRIIGGHIRF